MKKLLLATAAFALLAPAAHAEIKLDLGGYFKGYAGYATNDDAAGTSTRSFDIKRKSQVFFTGETTLDNGLTVGYNGQLMQDNNVNYGTTSADTQVEQSYLYFSGNWGRVNLGRENGAAYLLQVSAPSADANLDGQDIDFSFFNLGGVANVRHDYKQSGPRTGALTNQDQQYSDKITYLTPKFNGLQAGVSFTPSYDTKGRDAYFGMGANNTGGALDNMMEAAARYDGEFSGVGIHAGAGYTTASQQVETLANDDFKQWNAGLKLTMDAFGLGAAYTTDNGAANNNADNDTWVVGGDYTYGAYTFGLSYLNSNGERGAGVEDDYDRWTLGAGYTFGPGMKFNGSVALHDLDAGGVVTDNKATVVAVGTDIQF